MTQHATMSGFIGNAVGATLNGLMMHGVAVGHGVLMGMIGADDMKGIQSILSLAAGCYGAFAIASMFENLIFGSPHRLIQGRPGSKWLGGLENAVAGAIVNGVFAVILYILTNGRTAAWGALLEVLYFGAAYYIARSYADSKSA